MLTPSREAHHAALPFELDSEPATPEQPRIVDPRAERFVDALRRVQFEGAAELCPSSLEWMLSMPGIAPVVEWVGDHVREANYASEANIRRFEQLKSAGKHLEGDALQRELSRLQAESSSSSLGPAIDAMSDDQLQQLLSRRQQRLALLTTQHQALRAQTEELRQRARACVGQRDALVRAERTQRNAVIAASAEHQCALSKTKVVVHELERAYDDAKKVEGNEENVGSNRNGRHGNNGSPFFCHMDLSHVLAHDAQYAAHLKQFVAKQFTKEDDKEWDEPPTNAQTRWQWLRLHEPGSLLVHGESKQTHSAQAKEWARLKSIFAVSEMQSLQAHVGVVRGTVLVKALRHQLDLPTAADTPTHSLWGELGQLETALEGKQEDTRQQLQELQRLLMELAQFRGASMLHGEYSLKTFRLNHSINKTRTVVERLQRQQAWLLVLVAATHTESEHHKKTTKMLTALHNTLVTASTSHSGRLKYLRAISAACGASRVHPVQPVLHQLLATKPSGALPEACNSTGALLVSRAQALVDACANAKHDLSQMRSEKRSQTDAVRRWVEQLARALRADDSHAFLPSSVLPVEVAKVEANISRLVDELAMGLDALEADLAQKKQALDHDDRLRTEREFVEECLRSPSSAHTQLAALQQRLAALSAGL